DLKPSNVMVGRFGEVQVMDWGLAKILARTDVARSEEETEDGTLDEPRHEAGYLTDPGSVLGTWAYMPPEQARGLVAEVDQRAAVLRGGACARETLPGPPPYTGPGGGAVPPGGREARLDGASARLRACEADAELIGLAERCLAPSKADRPAEGG